MEGKQMKKKQNILKITNNGKVGIETEKYFVKVNLDLIKDKEVKGVCWSVTAFFAIYGVWSLIYYYSLCQQLSFVAGIFLTSGNLAWTILAIKYKK